MLKDENKLKFSPVEINHLLYLIEDNENNGFYIGNKAQYWKRSDRIRMKLLQIRDNLL